MQETQPGDTAPSHSATALKILVTARQLFMQRGYRAVSVNDIANAAHVTKPTLYYHFADKEELFVQMALHVLAEMHAAMEAAIADQPDLTGKLIALAERMLSDEDIDSRMLRHEMREHLAPEQQRRIGEAFTYYMFAPLRAVMQYGIDSSSLSGSSAEELAMLFLCFMEGFHYQIQGNRSQADTANTPFATITFTPETLVNLFLHGAAHQHRELKG